MYSIDQYTTFKATVGEYQIAEVFERMTLARDTTCSPRISASSKSDAAR